MEKRGSDRTGTGEETGEMGRRRTMLEVKKEFKINTKWN